MQTNTRDSSLAAHARSPLPEPDGSRRSSQKFKNCIEASKNKKIELADLLSKELKLPFDIKKLSNYKNSLGSNSKLIKKLIKKFKKSNFVL